MDALFATLRLVPLGTEDVPAVKVLLDRTLEVQYDAVFYHQLKHSPRAFGFLAVVYNPASEGCPPSPASQSSATGSMVSQKSSVVPSQWEVIGALTARSELSVTQTTRSSSGVPKVYLTALAVDPAWRRRHIATELLRHTLDYLRSIAGPLGVNVDLHALVSNAPALALYGRFGFVRRQFVKGYYTFNGARHDAVQLRVHVLPLPTSGSSSPPRPYRSNKAAADPSVRAAASVLSPLGARAVVASVPRIVPDDSSLPASLLGSPEGTSRRGSRSESHSNHEGGGQDMGWASQFCCCLAYVFACCSSPQEDTHSDKDLMEGGGGSAGANRPPRRRESAPLLSATTAEPSRMPRQSRQISIESDAAVGVHASASALSLGMLLSDHLADADEESAAPVRTQPQVVHRTAAAHTSRAADERV